MDRQDQQLKELLKGSFSNDKLSVDFTQNIMSKIEKVESKSPFEYTPVISLKGWIGIAAMIVGVVFLSILNADSSSTFYLPKLNYTVFKSPVLAISMCSIFFLLVLERSLNSRKNIA